MEGRPRLKSPKKERRTWTTPDRPLISVVPIVDSPDGESSPVHIYTRTTNKSKFSPDHGVITHLFQVEEKPPTPRVTSPINKQSNQLSISDQEPEPSSLLPQLKPLRRRWEKEPTISITKTSSSASSSLENSLDLTAELASTRNSMEMSQKRPDRRQSRTPQPAKRREHLPRRAKSQGVFRQTYNNNDTFSPSTSIELSEIISNGFEGLNPFSTPESFKATYAANNEFSVKLSPRQRITPQEKELKNTMSRGGLITFPLPDHLVSSIPTNPRPPERIIPPPRTMTANQRATSPELPRRARRGMGVIHQSDQARSILQDQAPTLQAARISDEGFVYQPVPPQTASSIQRNLQSQGVVYFSTLRDNATRGQQRPTTTSNFGSVDTTSSPNLNTPFNETDMSYENLLLLDKRSVRHGLRRELVNKFKWVTWFGDENSRECSICLDNFKKNEKLRLLPCSHLFHNQCILTHFQDQKFCPNCRRNYD